MFHAAPDQADVPHEQHEQSGAAPEPVKPLVEVGILAASNLNETDRQAVGRARDSLLDYLQRTFAQFTWRLPLLWREQSGSAIRQEPTGLLDYSVAQRNLQHWDFVLLISPAFLVSHYKSETRAALSRSLDAMVISTAQLDSDMRDERTSTAERVELIARRIQGLALHGLGHLNGLTHIVEPGNIMEDIESVEDVDQLTTFNKHQRAQMTENLRQIADRRLEEQEDYQRVHPTAFYLRSAWINRHEVLDALLQARPWQFPFRLSRLTTAAVSTMLILLMTAEAWDLGMNQTTVAVTLLSLLAMAFTTTYVLLRQRLFARRGHRARLSEQVVMANVSACAIVLCGMLTTYVLLLATTLVISLLLYNEHVVREWAASVEGPIGAGHYLSLAAFVASLGIIIGALGASFEQQHYFRHITFVDEEL